MRGQVEVEQDQVGPGHVGVVALLAQEGHGLLAVVDHVQLVADLVELERLPRQQDVARVVLDQEHVDPAQVIHQFLQREDPGLRTGGNAARCREIRQRTRTR
ncbi:hypothetical protein GCM10018952_03560 [Streptosporangium vulgare]